MNDIKIEQRKDMTVTYVALSLFFLAGQITDRGNVLEKLAYSFNLFSFVLILELFILIAMAVIFYMMFRDKLREGKATEALIWESKQTLSKFYVKILITIAGILLLPTITSKNILDSAMLFLILMYFFIMLRDKRNKPLDGVFG